MEKEIIEKYKVHPILINNLSISSSTIKLIVKFYLDVPYINYKGLIIYQSVLYTTLSYYLKEY